jgi:hypothetical protein
MIQKAEEPSTLSVVKRKRRKIRLFVLIDALGWEYVRTRDFLSDVLPYRGPLRTVLGFSSGAIPTILTGVPPSVNGHWNLFYYDPLGSPFRWLKYFQFLPDLVLNNRVSSKILKELGRRVLGLGPLFDCGVSPRLLRWFNWVEKRNIYQRGGINGASSIFDALGTRNVPHRIYSYHDLNDAQIVKHAKKDILDSDAEFLFLYLSEMDMFLHSNCSKPKEIDRKIAWYDAQLRDVFKTAQQIDPDASMTVFSDHGMTPVDQHFDLMREIELLPFRMPTDYLAIYDSTMARFWFFSEEARRGIVACLQQCGDGRILHDEELRDLGVYFEDRRYGQLVFLLKPGCLAARSDFNGPRWIPAGMHGYHPDDRFSDAIFLADRQPILPMRTIADVYPCMREAVPSA